MSVFFTSDLHLGHRAVAYTRRYGSWPKDKSLVTPEDVAWHDNMLAQNWDAVVQWCDVVWVLGDLIANAKHLPAAIDWMNERPGTKHIVLGNHDPAHPMHSDSHKYEAKYREAFASVATMRKRHITLSDGSRQTVLLSHFPYVGDGDSKAEDRDQYRLRNEGLPVLHGHTHNADKFTYAEGWRGHDYVSVPQIHVGLDAWEFMPVPLEEIAQLLQKELEYES